MTNQRLLSRFCHQYGICLAESKTPLISYKKSLVVKKEKRLLHFTGY